MILNKRWSNFEFWPFWIFYLPFLKSINYSISFEGSNQVYQLFNFDENGSSKSGFFLVLNEGDKASLIVKEKIKLYDEVPAKLGFTKAIIPKANQAKQKIKGIEIFPVDNLSQAIKLLKDI